LSLTTLMNTSLRTCTTFCDN